MVTVINKTVGPSGRDYTTIGLAEADIVNIITSNDMVTNDEAVVFTVDADTYGSVNISAPLTTDATRNVTYRCADRSNRPIVEGSLQCLGVRDDFTHIDGIDFSSIGGSGVKIFASQVGLTIENLSATCKQGIARLIANTTIGSASAPITIRNVICSMASNFLQTGNTYTPIYVNISNCTVQKQPDDPSLTNNELFSIDGDGGEVNIYNNIILEPTSDRAIRVRTRNYGTLPTINGSNNICPIGQDAGNSFVDFSIGSELTPTTDTDPGAGDWAIFVAETGKLVNDTDNDAVDAGVGPDSQSLISTIDFLGEARSGATTQVGAYATLFGTAAAVLPVVETVFSATPVTIANPKPISFQLRNDGEESLEVPAEQTLTISFDGTNARVGDTTRTITFPGLNMGHNHMQASGSVDASSSYSIVANSDSSKCILLRGLSLGSAVLTGQAIGTLSIQDDDADILTYMNAGSGQGSTSWDLNFVLPPGKSLIHNHVQYSGSSSVITLTVRYDIIDAPSSHSTATTRRLS